MVVDFSKTALLIIDVQEDFLPGGSLAVPKGDEILPVVQKLMSMPFRLLIASQDDHPPGHSSFASSHQGKKVFAKLGGQVLWPDHCVQGTPGHNFVGFTADKVHHVVLKGSDPQVDSYSAFYDNDKKRSTGLTEYLRQNMTNRLTVCGLATDYCVLATVLDAIKEGFEVDVIQEGCRGISSEDSKLAFEEMKKAGAHLFETVDAYSAQKESPTL